MSLPSRVSYNSPKNVETWLMLIRSSFDQNPHRVLRKIKRKKLYPIRNAEGLLLKLLSVSDPNSAMLESFQSYFFCFRNAEIAGKSGEENTKIAIRTKLPKQVQNDIGYRIRNQVAADIYGLVIELDFDHVLSKYTTQTLISINVHISIGLNAMNLLL